MIESKLKRDSSEGSLAPIQLLLLMVISPVLLLHEVTLLSWMPHNLPLFHLRKVLNLKVDLSLSPWRKECLLVLGMNFGSMKKAQNAISNVLGAINVSYIFK